MDGLLLTTYLMRSKKKEQYENVASGGKSAAVVAVGVMMSVLSIAISVYAAYLSWSCNSALRTDLSVKIICAFFAFWFGFIYMICYMLFWTASCAMAKRYP